MTDRSILNEQNVRILLGGCLTLILGLFNTGLYNGCGGEGGIRTLGTLSRTAH